MDNKKLIEIVNTKGISFEQFNTQADVSLIDIDESPMNDTDRKKLGFTQLNQRRTSRIFKSYKINDKIKNVISSIHEQQTWMILTEDWCGDSAQTVPYLYKISKLNDLIDLRILYRDDNLDIMDKYLTNGGRAIPKLVAFDKDMNELFQWGPRPEEAKILVAQWRAEGDTKDQFNEKLHLWYGRNRGKAVEEDLLKLLIQ